MTVAASGILSLPADRLRNAIAASSTWQTLTGTDNAADAKVYTHLFVQTPEPDDGEEYTLDENEANLPCVVVAPTDLGCVRDSGFGRYHTGSVAAAFHLINTAELSESDAIQTFLNNIGGVLGDVYDLAPGSGDYLFSTRMENSVQYLGRTSREMRDEVGDIFGFVVTFAWDDGGPQ